jgi:hypothetical protein
MLSDQNGVCAICKLSVKGTKHSRLCFDHDHKTGVVRGLLCWPCNCALGLLEDSTEAIQGMLDYINKHKEGGV